MPGGIPLELAEDLGYVMRRKPKSRKQLERLFDALYARAEKILKEFNPCEHKITHRKHSCLGHTVPDGPNNHPQCCCAGCQWWSNKGCQANKPLTCRTWLCFVAQTKNPDAYKKLNEIAAKVSDYGFYVTRGDKEMSIQKAMKQNSFDNV